MERLSVAKPDRPYTAQGTWKFAVFFLDRMDEPCQKTRDPVLVIIILQEVFPGSPEGSGEVHLIRIFVIGAPWLLFIQICGFAGQECAEIIHNEAAVDLLL